MPEMKLDAADAAELAEMLQFLSEWLARDPGRPGASLEEFVGNPAYGISQLRSDLERLSSCSAAATASSSSAHDRGIIPACRAYASPCGSQRRSSSRWRAAGAPR